MLGLEGILSKRADATYRSGRTTDWFKIKRPAWKEANKDGFEKMGWKVQSRTPSRREKSPGAADTEAGPLRP